MRRRYRRSGAEGAAASWSFMLTAMGARRSLFEREGFAFPSDCVSAEENLFVHEVQRRHGRGVFCPDLFVVHRRRPNLPAFLSQVFVNGKGRAQITCAAPSSFHAAVLAPAALAAYAASACILPGLWRWGPGIVYAAAVVFETLQLALVEGDVAAALRLPPLFPLAHAAYAAGFCSGVFGAAV
jgi:hypothetical protein